MTKGHFGAYAFEPLTSPLEPVTEPHIAALQLALRALAEGRSLSADEASSAFDIVMAGEASAVQIAALLFGLRSRGETPDEVIGAARALRRAMRRVELGRDGELVDTCGTGGGRVGTLNVSTGAAFLVAGAGIPVAKHGNRSFTSKSGSADVLEALGVAIDHPPERARDILAKAGVVFLFAPTYHPAMRHAAPVRRELAVATVMNVLGPLANPAGVTRQVLGVADAARGALLAQALHGLGAAHAAVVHAEVGMDEISPQGKTFVWEVGPNGVSEWRLDPAAYGLSADSLEDLAGGTPEENARRLEGLLRGEGKKSAARYALILNAAAALYVAGKGWTLEESVRRATEALDTGQAMAALERLRAATRRGDA